MAKKSGIKFKTNNFIPQAKKALSEKQSQSLKKVGAFLQGRAKLLAPTKNGQLRQSIEHDETDNSTQVGTNKSYAPYVEFGTGQHAEDGKGRAGGWWYFDEKEKEFIFTKGQKPQPFLRPAAENNIPQIVAIAKGEYKELNNE